MDEDGRLSRRQVLQSPGVDVPQEWLRTALEDGEGREGVVPPRPEARHLPARIFRNGQGFTLQGMHRGCGFGDDLPWSEACLPPGPEIERHAVDRGLEDRRPSAVGEQAQDL